MGEGTGSGNAVCEAFLLRPASAPITIQRETAGARNQAGKALCYQVGIEIQPSSPHHARDPTKAGY